MVERIGDFILVHEMGSGVRRAIRATAVVEVRDNDETMTDSLLITRHGNAVVNDSFDDLLPAVVQPPYRPRQ